MSSLVALLSPGAGLGLVIAGAEIVLDGLLSVGVEALDVPGVDLLLRRLLGHDELAVAGLDDERGPILDPRGLGRGGGEGSSSPLQKTAITGALVRS